MSPKNRKEANVDKLRPYGTVANSLHGTVSHTKGH